MIESRTDLVASLAVDVRELRQQVQALESANADLRLDLDACRRRCEGQADDLTRQTREAELLLTAHVATVDLWKSERDRRKRLEERLAPRRSWLPCAPQTSGGATGTCGETPDPALAFAG